jgi:hypothetical protein
MRIATKDRIEFWMQPTMGSMPEYHAQACVLILQTFARSYLINGWSNEISTFRTGAEQTAEKRLT